MGTENWFTVEEIDADTYVMSEYGHWEETHCYLLLGAEKAALIDTGLGVSNIGEVVEDLTDLPVTVFHTHSHWDHIGGDRYFEHIAVHEKERAWLAGGFPLPLREVKRNLTCKPCNFPADFQLDNYQIYQGEPEIIFQEGDTFELGNRRLTVLHTPGHHQLEIPVCLIGRIEKAFGELEGQGKLERGKGIFDFGDFQIHL